MFRVRSARLVFTAADRDGAEPFMPSARFRTSTLLVDAAGSTIGALVLENDKARSFTPVQIRQLEDLARIASATWQMRRRPGLQPPALEAREGDREVLQQARYGLLAGQPVDTMVTRRADGTRTLVSQCFVDLLGFTRSELDALTFARVVHPDDLEHVKSLIADLSVGAIDHAGSTYRLRHKHGHWVWVDARFRLIRDVAGVPQEVLATARDVTVRVEAEEALRAGEARYRTLTDALPQMVWVISGKDDLVAIYMNEQFRAFYGPIGSIREERISRNHPDDAPHMARAWKQALEGKQSYTVEGRLRRHDGVYRWHRLVMLPVHRSGEVVEWIGTALDIDDIVAAKNLLMDTTDLLRLAQEAAGAGVWDWRMGEGTLRHSVASARMHGVDLPVHLDPDSEIAMTLGEWESRVCPEDLPGLWNNVAQAIAERKTYSSEFRTLTAGGGYRWLIAFGRVIFDSETGEPLRIVGLHFDITGRRKAEQALRQSEARLRVSEERLALALDSSDEGLWDWNLRTGAVWVSDRWYEMLGYTSASVEGARRFWMRTIHPADRAKAIQGLRKHLRGNSPIYQCEYRLRHKDGRLIWVLVRGKVVNSDASGPIRIVGTQFEVTRRKEAEARVEHLAMHDSLTGLANRTLFRARLNQEFERAAQQAGSFAVLCLDLDRFKEINDSLGHPSGDALLRIAAERLSSIVAGSGTLARLGGDEFVVILARPGAERDAGTLAQALIASIGEPLVLEGRQVHIGVSIGIAMGPRDGGDADALFKNADIALYQAKAAGRNTFRYYEAGMDAAIAARKQLDLDLREALRRQQLAVHYQPILDVEHQSVVGFESLLRWRHPERGLVSPAEFIPIAEDNGLIVGIGAWVLLQACREAASWPGDLRVSVNVSAVQFGEPGLEDSVVRALAASGLPARRLELEVTETVLLKDTAAVLACLHRLRDLGIAIALDDFGTGFSSLAYLRRFPFDRIKIDQSFVGEIAEPNTAAIVEATVDLGHKLGARITAEGVETESQLLALRQRGCNEAQGFLFSRPLEPEEIDGFFARAGVRAAA